MLLNGLEKQRKSLHLDCRHGSGAAQDSGGWVISKGFRMVFEAFSMPRATFGGSEGRGEASAAGTKDRLLLIWHV